VALDVQTSFSLKNYDFSINIRERAVSKQMWLTEKSNRILTLVGVAPFTVTETAIVAGYAGTFHADFATV
jgi:hypothetical protein